MNAPDPPAGEDPRLLEHALRIADHERVDWERSRVTASDLEATLERLREVEAVADAFRATPRDTPVPPAAVAFAWGPLLAIECLGRGASGEVWRAWDPALQRDVALKLLNPDGRTRAQWLAEARRHARVRHPHVVTVHGADSYDGRAGLWMDLVRGRTLEELLAELGPLGAREAAGIGVELCGALAAVHGAGLVHCDLKAGNVLREGLPRGRSGAAVTGAGHVWLMDFGSAHVPSAGSAGSAHTPLYAAPEVLAGDAPSVRSDVYSLGVLLFRLVTGRFPAEAASVTELRDTLARGESLSLRSLRPDLPPAFVQAIERALAPDPTMRFAECGEFERALGAVALDHPVRGGGATRARVLGFAGGALLVGLAWTIVTLWRERPPGVEMERPRPPFVAEVTERFAGLEPGGNYGTSIAVMDLHGKGSRELLVGAPGESLGAGRVHVLRRGTDGKWSEEFALASGTAGCGFGGCVADIGDVNGDGWHDLAVGATHQDASGRRAAGAVYVYFGGPRFHTVPDLVLQGPSALGAFGFAIAGVGDLNQDGIDDFVVSAPCDDRAGPSAGRVFVFLGGRPPSATPAFELAPTSAEGQFGASVAAAGDFNGDGVPDLAVGANWNRDGGRPRGRVMVWYGGRTLHQQPDWFADGPDPAGWFGIVRGAGDLNGDGYSDLVVGAGHAHGAAADAGAAYVYFGGVHPDTRPALTLPGNRPGDGLGYTVAAPGDLDGDGYPDLAIAASGSDAAAPGAGAVKIYLGGPHMDSRADVVLTGDAASDEFGISLAGAGDLDGDGLADLLVGSPWPSPRARAGGEAWLVGFARHRWLRPRPGERLVAGAIETLRWLGREPAEVALTSDGGAHWRTLARAAGGREENAISLRLPLDLRGTARFRLTPSDPRRSGHTPGPALPVDPR